MAEHNSISLSISNSCSFISSKLDHPTVCLPRIQMVSCRQAQLLSDLPAGPFKIRGGGRKDKVVVVMGATGTGKSRLAIDLATRFGVEVVNSDKMQVYDGLDVVTNKVTEAECAGVPHHLLGGVAPDAEFTATDFRCRAALAVESIVGRGRLPVIAGGSNSYIEELIDGERRAFGMRYDCCFLWVDVELPVLHAVVADRVDQMVERGLVEEVRGLFDPAADYSRGVRRAIGVPEMDEYLRAEGPAADEAARVRMLAAAINDIKVNTCKLACCQLQKIHRLRARWGIHRIDATGVFRKRGEESDEAWEKVVVGPSLKIVRRFLHEDNRSMESSEGMMGRSGKAVVAVEHGASAVLSAAAMTTKLFPAVEAVGATV